MTMLVTAVVVMFGFASYFRLPVSDLPVVDSPVITVTVSYPGASPSTMASTVAAPLENQFMQIQGLRSIISSNTQSQTQIMLTFDLTRNVDLAAPDVQAAISNAQGNLPSDLPAPPSYSKTNPSDMPIIYLSLSSDTLTATQLYDYANNTISKRLSMIYGVSQVQIWGAKSAIRIQADPDRLAAMGIGFNDVNNAIVQSTVTLPGGSLNGSFHTYSIEPEGQLMSAKSFEDLIVAYRGNSPVYLRDIATCVDSLDNDLTNVMTWTHQSGGIRTGAVILAVSRAAGSNTVELTKNIKETVEGLKDELPASVILDVFFDKSESIVESINDVKTTILIALFLVILVIFIFLGRLSDTVIPSVTVPLSILMTFIVMSALGYSLDNLSLMGIILAIGFVVDDAIVVLENTVRHIEEGKKPFDAAAQSAKEITFTIISMTLSLAIIFVPLIFMGGVIGRTFREFAMTVVITIICSGIISLTLTPMMCARMLKEKGKESSKTALQHFMDKIMNGVILGYREHLRWCLNHKSLMLIAWVACLIGTGILFTILPKSFIPEGDSGALHGQFMVPLGTSTEQVIKYQKKINQVLISDPRVDKMLTVSGTTQGADQSTGPFVVVLKPKHERPSVQKITQDLRKKLYMIPDGLVFMAPIPLLKISTGGESTATGSKYSYIMKGQDQDKLYAAALELEKELRDSHQFIDIQNSVRLDMPQLTINLLRDRASSLGLTASDIETALYLCYSGGRQTIYKTDTDQYNIILEADKRFQREPDDLTRIFLRPSATSDLVPFSSIIDIERTVGPQNVPHYNQLNSATISFNIAPGIALGTATDTIEKIAFKLLPPGATGRLQGEAQQFQEAIASLGIMILIAVFIKYIVLGILYESYVHPFTVITTLPVGTVGGLATLLIFGAELSMYAYIGVFLLLGIVAKNGIMMVDFANQLISEGKSDFDAILEAAAIRFRPILMTGLAAIMGAVPLALGYGADGSSRIPLGLVIVGGLIFSQVVTLFITPAIFLYMQTFQRRYLDKFELTRSASDRVADGAGS